MVRSVLKHCLATLVVLFSTSFELRGEKLDFEIGYTKCPDIAVFFEGAYSQDKNKVAIVLNDGTQWLIRNDEYDTFNHISNNWQFGDEIRIVSRDPDEYMGKFILKNVRNAEVCFVDLDTKHLSLANFLYITKIDKNGYVLFLDDGVEWFIGYWSSIVARNWDIGDRIIINKSRYSSDEDYLLINVDKKKDVWASMVIWN